MQELLKTKHYQRASRVPWPTCKGGVLCRNRIYPWETAEKFLIDWYHIVFSILSAERYDAITTIRCVIKKLSKYCWAMKDILLTIQMVKSGALNDQKRLSWVLAHFCYLHTFEPHSMWLPLWMCEQVATTIEDQSRSPGFDRTAVWKVLHYESERTHILSSYSRRVPA
jgi:hypothetical protein